MCVVYIDTLRGKGTFMKFDLLKKFVVLGVIVLTCAPSFATNWVKIGANHYIDSDSIRPSTNYGTYTMRTKYTTNAGPLEVINGRNIYTINTNSFIDCTSNYAKTVSYSALDRSGRVVASGRNVWKQWYDINRPGSRAYESYEYVCSDKYLDTRSGYDTLWYY